MIPRVAFAAVVLPILVSWIADPPQGGATTASRPAAAAAGGDADFVLVFLKSPAAAPKKSPEESKAIQAAHLANIGRLAREGPLLIAGPFAQPAPEPNARGLFIFDVATVAEAEKLSATDPAVQAGTLVAESWPMRASASLRRMRDLERESTATRPAPAPGEPPFGIRAFVIGVADDAAAAEKALAPMRADGRVVIFGRLGGAKAGRALFVLAATSVKAGEETLAPVRAAMGPVSLHGWYSSENVAKLGAPAGEKPASRKAG